MTATFYVGDAITVMNTLPEKSVDLILTSPPFLALRSYLPQDHPDKALEGGSQSTPGEYVDWLLNVVESCARVLAPHGSLVFELGDTFAGSGGAGGDYLNAGLRDGQPVFDGSATRGRTQDRDYDGGASDRWDFAKPGTNSRLASGSGWPLAKSLSLIPETFRFAMVYGRNPHTGRTTSPWRLRNVIRWVRPNPPVGALGDKFRPATSELMVFCKAKDRYFDLDAVRTVNNPERMGELAGGVKRETARVDIGLSSGSNIGKGIAWNQTGAPPLDWWNVNEETATTGQLISELITRGVLRQQGAPGNYVGFWNTPETGLPLDWWNIPPGGFSGAHYAVWPPELLIKPIKAMCPEKVCRQCGEPSRRIVAEKASLDEHYALARHIKERRIANGFSLTEVNGWFGYTPETHNWETSGKGISIPNPDDWPILKERLGLSDDFDDLVMGDRRWTESTVDYLTETGRALAPAERRVAYDRGGLPPVDVSRVKANRQAPETFSDCGHRCPNCDGTGIHGIYNAVPVTCAVCVGTGDPWRPGLVLDPFGGSGTTALVATGHGRDCTLIDLDERNYELALDRVGPFILERAS